MLNTANYFPGVVCVGLAVVGVVVLVGVVLVVVRVRRSRTRNRKRRPQRRSPAPIYKGLSKIDTPGSSIVTDEVDTAASHLSSMVTDEVDTAASHLSLIVAEEVDTAASHLSLIVAEEVDSAATCRPSIVADSGESLLHSLCSVYIPLTNLYRTRHLHFLVIVSLHCTHHPYPIIFVKFLLHSPVFITHN